LRFLGFFLLSSSLVSIAHGFLLQPSEDEGLTFLADSSTRGLTGQEKYAIGYDMKQTYSTAEAARMIGINRVTLQRWLIDGKVKEPKKVRTGGVEVRVWTDRDVERVRKHKQENYRKGRGRKPKSKR
jgi:hypothetical protein